MFAADDLTTARLVAAVADVFEVRDVRGAANPGFALGLFRRLPVTIQISGRLLVPSEAAYDVIAARFRALGYIAFLRRRGQRDVVLAMPGELPVAPTRYGVAVALFLVTLISTLWVGAGLPDPGEPLRLVDGWPFAASLLGILLAHELGHFFASRRLGVPASPPYFIPMPVSFLGTMGAVIQMKSPPRNRRALLGVAIAGPLAGLVVAIPVLLLGLSLSEVQPFPVTGLIVQEGNSLLYAALKLALFGRVLPAGGEDVFLHPVALAGWAGLLVTGLNLIPAGQLDGGHVAYILFGERARWLTAGVVVALLGLSLLWQGWLLWAGLVFLFGRVHAVPLDDVTPLRSSERALAILVLLIFALVFVPIPLEIR
ncbi:MAG: site-2 protease family protein [Chloroflexi bacterium]|nr:site-2 protease family protein [Chloroflexota bacterium]